MFLNNKYKRWYYQIVNRARKRGVPEGYFEKHHVIPRCMGGKNDFWNIVNLTYREHYIVHWLLIKMTVGKHKKSMWFAFKSMTAPVSPERHVPARWIERLRKVSSFLSKGSKHNLGRKQSEETKRKRSLALVGNKNSVGKNTGKRGKVSEEVRARVSAANGMRGKHHTEETKLKMSESATGKPFTNEMRIGQQVAYAKRRELASGHGDWRKCHFCQKYDAPENLYIREDGSWHKKCRNKWNREKYKMRRLAGRLSAPAKDSEEYKRKQSIASTNGWARNKEAKFRAFSSTYGI